MISESLIQLMLFRFRLFWREPSAVFWTYGFPIILTVSLGIAFRNRPVERIFVDVVESHVAPQIVDALAEDCEEGVFAVGVRSADEARERLRLGHCAVVVAGRADGNAYDYSFDPTRPNSVYAKDRVDDALQRAAGRLDPRTVALHEVTEPGSRYIDFLVPGLLGMNLMGSGLWGVGFVAVDLRVRKLLKRFSATPMRRSHFLWSLIGARMIFTIPEMVILLAVGAFLFGVPVRGSVPAILVVVLAGGVSFAGIGLLVASRAERIETVAGLMNLVMLPMWLLSGIFFSTSNFPEAFQPLVQALPLTQLNNALRAVVLEGATLTSQWLPMAVLLGVAVLAFYLALRWFKWA